MQNQKNPVSLQAFDHRLIDQSTAEIVENCQAHWCAGSRSDPLPTRKGAAVLLISARWRKRCARSVREIRTLQARLVDIVEPTENR